MMIPLCDRRSACLLLQYCAHGLTSSSTLEKLPSLSLLSSQASLAAIPTPTPKRPAATDNDTTITTPKELARFVATQTPKEFLQAVKDSGGTFLYRGEEPREGNSCFGDQRIITRASEPSVVRICDPSPDLLLPETYGYDPVALRYFEELEALLSIAPRTTASKVPSVSAKPSNGHIATSDPTEAGKWGNVVSVWPRLPSQTPSAARFSYVWPRNRCVFYESERKGSQTHPMEEPLARDENLQDALTAKGGREVLFAFASVDGKSSAAFLAIPIALDQALREELETIGYGL